MCEVSDNAAVHVGTVNVTGFVELGQSNIDKLLLHTQEPVPAVALQGVHTTADYTGTSSWGDEYIDGHFESTAPERGYFIPISVVLHSAGLQAEGDFLRLAPTPTHWTSWGHVSNKTIARWPQAAHDDSPQFQRAVALADKPNNPYDIEWIVYSKAKLIIPRLGHMVSAFQIVKEEYFCEG